MIAQGPAVPTTVAAAIIATVIGGVIGFYARDAQVKPGNSQGAPPPGSAMARGGGGGGGMGGGGGRGGGGGMMGGGGGRGGGMGGGPQQPSPKGELTGLVRNLATIEKIQGKGLTEDQKKALAPILKKIQEAPKLTDEDCKPEIESINKILATNQQDAIKVLSPPRGGMVAGQDPDRPFATPRNKEALEDLITAVQK